MRTWSQCPPSSRRWVIHLANQWCMQTLCSAWLALFKIILRANCRAKGNLSFEKSSSSLQPKISDHLLTKSSIWRVFFLSSSLTLLFNWWNRGIILFSICFLEWVISNSFLFFNQASLSFGVIKGTIRKLKLYCLYLSDLQDNFLSWKKVLTTERKLVIGRREIHNSLKKSCRKLSRDHVEILPRIIDGIAKISIKPLGRNPVFTAKYEYPMHPISKVAFSESQKL